MQKKDTPTEIDDDSCLFRSDFPASNFALVSGGIGVVRTFLGDLPKGSAVDYMLTLDLILIIISKYDELIASHLCVRKVFSFFYENGTLDKV